MHVAIAGLMLESVSFLPEPTTLADFQRRELVGRAVIDGHRGTNQIIGGFVEVCEAEAIEMTGIVSAGAGAAASATDEAFDHYCRVICEGVAAVEDRINGVLLALHGAMTTVTRTDPDADIVREVRRIVGAEMPIVVGLDYHGNLDEEILRHADALFGYHYSPHTDMGETGARAARCLVRWLKTGKKPATAIARPNVMVPSIFSATNLEPLAGLVRESVEMPAKVPGLHDVTIFAGFSYADAPNTGFSVVAVADDKETAQKAADDLSLKLHYERHQLYKRDLVLGLRQGVDEALRRSNSARKPIVLLEHADRLNDSTHILKELIKRGAPKAMVPFLWDPKAAAEAVAAGKGATVSLKAGGFSSDRAGGPATLKGTVLFAGDLTYRTTGPVGRGSEMRLGPTALIDAGGIFVSLTTNPATAIDTDCFTQFGLKPEDFPIIVLRSKTHFRAVYQPLAEDILIVDTPDWGPADLTTLPYRHVPVDRVFPFVDRGRP
jgi:microcystin degradation protein MlrC